MTPVPDHEIAIIGGGPGGIAAAAKLTEAGLTDFVIIDRAADFGGSWHENTYPGLGVDVPAITYQYSFARNPDWSRVFPKGAEVKKYHVEVAKRFGLYEHARFDTDIVTEHWDESASLWRLATATGDEITARYVISAVGAFVNPKLDPGIPGLADFRGKIQRAPSWDHGYDHTGKRVAIIGTGASSVQITPTIAPEVAALSVFQRTPVWVLPKPDFRIPAPARRVLRTPGLQAAVNGVALMGMDVVLRVLSGAPPSTVEPVLRQMDQVSLKFIRRYLKWVVKDPVTRAALTPDFGPIAKRPTFSNAYLRAYNRANVDLITAPIETFTADGIRTRDGVEHTFDMIVLATGYEVFSDPETYREGMVTGREGFDLGKFYTENGLQAYEGVAIPKLPNRWMLVGPYCWTGSGWHAFVEMTADHAVRAIREAHRRKAVRMEVRQDVHDAYHGEVITRSAALRYYFTDLNKHVATYYRNSQGDSTYLRPSGFFAARRAHRTFPFTDYTFETAATASPARAATNGRAKRKPSPELVTEG
ncbi:NAD(P)/FAD-dependent oxidoreductase [Nocardia uniformis]|uniref:NAD(P)/FAD-dependent oxidoreductase n=1 Tax=Nocardia uniformis TaxID=53432 RepID=A0A849C540_9NOCA|nr:NAD(P)/FAD-dependent oxidoreductase [Nocardia uniformis]NNH70927.1 NAD(P)/FAD-dependent oxidoreductase [Nocardia uniformis]